MPREITVAFASQEALKFHARLEELFLALVLNANAWISESSSLREFLSESDPYYAKGPGTKAGYFVFRRCLPWRENLVDAGVSGLDEHEWEYEEVEERGFDHTAEIIRRTKFYFGVDITPVFSQTFPVIFQYISENMTPRRRSTLAANGWVGRRFQHYLTNPRRVDSTYWPTSPGYLFRVDEYADGHCLIHAKKRQSRGHYRMLQTAERFDTSLMRPQLDAWLKSQGALSMNPWGEDDPRNIAEKERWTRTENEGGSVTLSRREREDGDDG